MGLTVSVMKPMGTSWRGSYTYFNKFRDILAEATGTNLSDMVGYGGKTQWSGEEPFYELLDHSDSEGSIWEIEDLAEDFDNKEYHARFKEVAERMDLTQYINTWDEWVWMLTVADTEGGMIRFG